jgi:hypothetical protein
MEKLYCHRGEEMSGLEELIQERELKKFKEAIGAEGDTVMLLLRGHLYSENLLERLINFGLPRGDKLMENASLSYHQKLLLVEALDFLPDTIASSLRNLNKLRNQCAHQLNKKISEADITRIGSPLGKSFTEYKHEADFNEAGTLRKVINHVCGYLAGKCCAVEGTSGRNNS